MERDNTIVPHPVHPFALSRDAQGDSVELFVLSADGSTGVGIELSPLLRAMLVQTLSQPDAGPDDVVLSGAKFGLATSIDGDELQDFGSFELPIRLDTEGDAFGLGAHDVGVGGLGDGGHAYSSRIGADSIRRAMRPGGLR